MYVGEVPESLQSLEEEQPLRRMKTVLRGTA
jgi:hypothetical protein